MKREAKLLVVTMAMALAAAGPAAAASSPTVQTGSASAIRPSSARLRGSVDPNGAPTSYQFQFGLTSAYGPASTTRAAGRGTSAIAAATTVSGLIPGTVYHYRLAARSKYGASLGADRRFKTASHAPPGAVTGPPSTLSASSATLTGAVNPNGERTNAVFQYGLTTAYGTQILAGTVSAAGPATVSARASGLEPGTLFHYRLVALHGTSVASYGRDLTFITYPSPRPVPQVRATTRPHRARHRPYELTTHATVLGPRSLPDPIACGQNANATISYFLGRRRVAFSFAAVQSNCTFSSTVVFKHGFRHRRHAGSTYLRVVIHFRGNGYLAPANAGKERVRLG